MRLRCLRCDDYTHPRVDYVLDRYAFHRSPSLTCPGCDEKDFGMPLIGIGGFVYPQTLRANIVGVLDGSELVGMPDRIIVMMEHESLGDIMMTLEEDGTLRSMNE